MKAKKPNTQQEVICAYTSGMFLKAKLNYHINEKEFHAAKKAIEKFDIYLKPAHFTLHADNKCFPTFLKNKLDKCMPQTRLLRW